MNKTLITCLLIVAIPVQSFAATAMRVCSPGHHGAAVTAHETPHQAANYQRMHAAHMNQVEASSDHVVATTSDLGHGKCSACASCCLALAIVSSRPVPDNTATTTVVIPFLANAFSNHISDGLDPPPRSILA